MANGLRLIIGLPGETLLDAEAVDWVHVTLANDKGLTIYPAHASILVETAADQLCYQREGEVHSLDLPAGVLYVRDNVVSLFLSHMVGEKQPAARPKKRGAFDRLAQILVNQVPKRRSW